MDDHSLNEWAGDSHGFNKRFPGLEQLICAALADSSFAEALIREPCHPLHEIVHQFVLTPQEQALICSVHGAADIHEFAARLYRQTRLQADLPECGENQ